MALHFDKNEPFSQYRLVRQGEGHVGDACVERDAPPHPGASECAEGLASGGEVRAGAPRGPCASPWPNSPSGKPEATRGWRGFVQNKHLCSLKGKQRETAPWVPGGPLRPRPGAGSELDEPERQAIQLTHSAPHPSRSLGDRESHKRCPYLAALSRHLRIRKREMDMERGQGQVRRPGGLHDTAQTTTAHTSARDPILCVWFTEACGGREPQSRTQGSVMSVHFPGRGCTAVLSLPKPHLQLPSPRIPLPLGPKHKGRCQLHGPYHHRERKKCQLLSQSKAF